VSHGTASESCPGSDSGELGDRSSEAFRASPLIGQRILPSAWLGKNPVIFSPFFCGVFSCLKWLRTGFGESLGKGEGSGSGLGDHQALTVVT